MYENYEEPVDAEVVSETGIVRVGTSNIEAAANSERNRLAVMVELAKRFPRDMIQVEKEVLGAARYLGSRVVKDSNGKDPATSLAVWGFRIGGQWTEGITIHMAKEIAKCYGNCLSYCTLDRFDGDLMKGGDLYGSAYFFDAQRNYMSARPFIAALAKPSGNWARNTENANRWRVMQVSSAVSKNERGAIERSVGRHLVEMAREEAKAQLSRDILKGMSLEQAKLALIDRYARLEPSVGVPNLENYLQEGMKSWTPEHLLQLRLTYTAIYDGQTTVEAVFFPQKSTTVTPEDVAGAKATKAAPKAEKAQEQPAQPPAQTPAAAPEPSPANGQEGNSATQEKKRVGRPPGSKNKPKEEPLAPAPDSSPAVPPPEPPQPVAPAAPVARELNPARQKAVMEAMKPLGQKALSMGFSASEETGYGSFFRAVGDALKTRDYDRADQIAKQFGTWVANQEEARKPKAAPTTPPPTDSNTDGAVATEDQGREPGSDDDFEEPDPNGSSDNNYADFEMP